MLNQSQIEAILVAANVPNPANVAVQILAVLTANLGQAGVETVLTQAGMVPADATRVAQAIHRQWQSTPLAPPAASPPVNGTMTHQVTVTLKKKGKKTKAPTPTPGTQPAGQSPPTTVVQTPTAPQKSGGVGVGFIAGVVVLGLIVLFAILFNSIGDKSEKIEKNSDKIVEVEKASDAADKKHEAELLAEHNARVIAEMKLQYEKANAVDLRNVAVNVGNNSQAIGQQQLHLERHDHELVEVRKDIAEVEDDVRDELAAVQQSNAYLRALGARNAAGLQAVNNRLDQDIVITTITPGR